MTIANAHEAVLAAFRGGTYDGEPLTVVSDVNHIDTPCVFIPTPRLTFRFAQGEADAAWEAFLVVSPSADDQTAGAQLSRLVDATTTLGLPLIGGEMYDLALPGGTTAPAFRVTWNQNRIPIGAEA